MISKISSICILVFLNSIFLFAQNKNDEVLMTIGNQEVTIGEFQRIYNKNNTGELAEKQTVDEYLDLFINFKLKVIEAENLGMDTTESFLNEFNKYKDQLAQPYLTDPSIDDKLAKKAYDKLKKEIHASHIMISLDPKASPEDTLYAYKKLMGIRERILNGEDFEKVARATSDDPSAKQNGGDLGWFTVFKMVEAFEEAAYQTPTGQISLPVRTNYGYHLIKVDGVRPARGKVQVAHIFLRAPESLSKEQAQSIQEKALVIYDSLQKGVPFADLAKDNSDDRRTALNGGVLPAFGTGQMIKEFETAAFSLQNPGDFSKPVKSFYGWHILKLIKKQPVGSFEDEKADIMSKLYRGRSRKLLKQDIFVTNLKNEYGYHLNQENLDLFNSLVDSTVFEGKWDKSVIKDKADQEIFTIDDHVVAVGDFASYIESQQGSSPKTNIQIYVNSLFKKFEQEEIINYEKSMLDKKYPEYASVLQEYHDGILLFDLTDKKVWTKAVEDTIGLEKFYAQHKKDYMWEKRAEAYIIILNDSSMIDKARKIVEKYGSKRKFDEEFLKEKLCAKDTVPCFEFQYGKFEKEGNAYVDSTQWKLGMGDAFTENGKPGFVYVISIIDPEIKKLEEARGMVTADYQDKLEKEWIKELRDKYPISINEELLESIKD